MPNPVDPFLKSLGDVLATLQRIEGYLDFAKRWQETVRAWTIEPTLAGLSMIRRTATVPGDQAFTSDPTIAAWQPLAVKLALLGLTAVVVWGFYRVMFAHGSFTQYTARILLPRFVIAGGAIAFSNQLVQAAVDFNNALTEAVLGQALSWDYLNRMLAQWAGDMAAVRPGLGPVTGAAILVGFVLLVAVYFVRYALLVVLTILAPVAALLLVLPETKKYATEWGSLFLTTLLMQPLQVFILSVGLSLEARTTSVFRHFFALAAVWMCFKVPGALRMASSVGSHAESVVHKQASQAIKVAGKLARVAAV